MALTVALEVYLVSKLIAHFFCGSIKDFRRGRVQQVGRRSSVHLLKRQGGPTIAIAADQRCAKRRHARFGRLMGEITRLRPAHKFDAVWTGKFGPNQRPVRAGSRSTMI